MKEKDFERLWVSANEKIDLAIHSKDAEEELEHTRELLHVYVDAIEMDGDNTLTERCRMALNFVRCCYMYLKG